jgi:hypothetical protein
MKKEITERRKGKCEIYTQSKAKLGLLPGDFLRSG